MKLIEDLGVRTKGKYKKKHRFGLYECPICGAHNEYLKSRITTGEVTKCSTCANIERGLDKIRKAAELFIEKSIKVHGNRYSYRLVAYKGAKVRVAIVCREHGEFMQTPNTHLNGRGCPKCGNNIVQAIKDATSAEHANQFIEKSIEVHGRLYSYILSKYLGAKVKIEIICPVHGSFWQLPYNHIHQGHGCPSCASYGFDSSKSATLYYLKIFYDEQIAYKVGITNRTVNERFNNSDIEKIQVLKTWDFPLGKDAYDKEQRILKLHREYKYVGTPILSSGNTELFTIDVLGLDY